MVGRRIAPDGRVMDPHPNGFVQHLINVRRIHKEEGYPMAKVPQLPRILKGLKIAYKEIWGSQSLLTKSRLPFTRDMLVRMVQAPEGCMLPFGKVGTHKWVVFKAIMCAAASCGFRLDEVTDWKFVDGGRSHLR